MNPVRLTLQLHRDKEGNAQRIHGITTLDKNVIDHLTLGVARWRDSAQGRFFTLPPDPTFVRALHGYITQQGNGDISLSQDLIDWLRQYKTKQEELAQAVTVTAPLDVNDRLWGDVQRASVRALDAGKRIILGHPMGAGKTVIASYAIKYLGLEKVIVVCPNNVKWSWAIHLQEWADRKDIWVVESGKFSRRHIDVEANVICGSATVRSEHLRKLQTASESYILILNYSQVRLHKEDLKLGDHHCLVLDEAHRAKNNKAQQTKAVHALARKIPYVWLLTGTPLRRCYTDLWSLLHLCDPLRFSSFWNFVATYLTTTPAFWGGVEITGLRNQAEFNQMLAAYMFRKEKAEILPELPDKVYRDIPLPLNSKQEKAYRQMEKEFVLAIKKELTDGRHIDSVLRAPTVVAQLIRLRQICLTPAILGGVADSAKLDALRELFEDLEGQQFILFSCFKQFLYYVAQICKEMEIPYALITGDQSSSERMRIQQDLTSGKIQGILGTMHSMGEGMNLQAASTAIFTDIDWIPAVNQQAEDRIHRPGVKSSPTIVRLYHPNTVEVDIRRACLKKEKMAENTVGQVETLRELLRRVDE